AHRGARDDQAVQEGRVGEAARERRESAEEAAGEAEGREEEVEGGGECGYRSEGLSGFFGKV
ncbi:hypothetical protein LTS18_006285, partial [Coniosporium uncinatum]